MILCYIKDFRSNNFFETFKQYATLSLTKVKHDFIGNIH